MKRVLVVGMMGNRGGTEAVVDNYVTALRGRLHFDFLMHEEPVHESFSANGNRTFVIPAKRRDPAGYRRAITEFFIQHAEEYSAIWANMNSLSNIDSLKYAKNAGVPRRIVHAHNSEWLANPLQKTLSLIHRKQLGSYVTDRWACSKDAGDLFFGDADYTIIPNSFDVSRFAFSEDGRVAVRKQYGCDGKLVIGTVGRMSRQKNQMFLVEIIPAVLERMTDFKLLIVGGGDSHAPLVDRARELGVSDYLVLAGMQTDIPAFLSSFDVFVLPSLFEGNPVSLMEARVCGLPCVVSDSIELAQSAMNSVQKLPLDDIEAWVDAICECATNVRCKPEPEELLNYDISIQKEKLFEMLVGDKLQQAR